MNHSEDDPYTSQRIDCPMCGTPAHVRNFIKVDGPTLTALKRKAKQNKMQVSDYLHAILSNATDVDLPPIQVV